MRDSLGRQIDYLRLSVTDQCNLRCRYCMPEGQAKLPEDLLSFAELLSVCRAALRTGIRHFKITGGEPLLRKGVAGFLSDLRALPGVDEVTLTTNGLLLEPLLPELASLVDSINISLDAVSEPLYMQIAGFPGAERALRAIRASVQAGIHTKVNTVLLEENRSEWPELLVLARDLPVDVRFIERMPIGSVRRDEPLMPASVLLDQAMAAYPDLRPSAERGSGPARYYKSRDLRGRLGVIAANSQRFCAECNRLRLTSAGQLRPCLGHPQSIDLRSAIRSGADEEALGRLLQEAVRSKPAAHDFASADGQNPARFMNEIGG